ncbi:MAG: 2Fe-2S iron-sulfur cluster binding domain-containing protein [Rhodocyclaceae bacterium]|nr:2Fe-2S iron-sulfur cluster binding domain-containing protein [Rhodocyclaceae bacterium]MBX3667692.1 2Fe-2S iron-sulfur cluster binding domain-containing protein [Rhodocyclaceae bacterium]
MSEQTPENFIVELSPNGGRFECAPGQTILDAALAAGYWLPHSCRAGSCDTCHLTLLGGSVQHAAPVAEGTPLPPEGICRTCRASACSNVMLDAPNVPKDPGQRVVATGAKVVQVDRPSHDVVTVRLQVPASSGFRFQAGQYANVIMKDGARRHYSMANAPDGDGMIEWHIRRMEGGRFSTHAYDKLKAGVMLRIEGPYGTFLLHPGDAPIVLLASGTGYAPIAALLKTHGAELARRGAVLYWGGRVFADLYAVESVAAWEALYPGVRIVPVLSEAGPEWTGRTGFVHAAVLADLPDLSRHEVYACGNPLMIDAARSSFTSQAGLPADKFFADAFVINT